MEIERRMSGRETEGCTLIMAVFAQEDRSKAVDGPQVLLHLLSVSQVLATVNPVNADNIL